MASSELDLLEPIAIVGLSLKFPQDATSPQKFWEMLVEGRTASTRVPSDRFNVDSHCSAGTKRLDEVRCPLTILCIEVEQRLSATIDWLSLYQRRHQAI